MDYMIHTDQGEILVEKASGELNSELIDQLIALRKELSMTQQDVADATGINRANVARVESKKHTTSLEILAKYAKSVGKDLRISLVDRQKGA